jgi:hypothetical protein
VLLPWNKTVRLVIDTGEVTARVAFRGAPIVDIVTPVAVIEDDFGPYGDIAGAIRNTIAQLSAQASRPFHTVDVIIADSFVFYDVLEMDARLLSSSDLNRAAGLGLTDTLGMNAGELTIRCSVQKGGLSVVVCGVPVALLDVIKHEIKVAGCNLNRLEPAFADFLNHHRSVVDNRHALIARVKNYSLMLGLLRDGIWQAFAAERLSTNAWTELRDCCDAFCSRISVIDYESLPILFDAEIVDIPAHARDRWRPLAIANEIF